MTGKELDEPVIVTVLDGYGSLSDALSATLDQLDLGREDAAVAQLARRLADVIDTERNGRTVAEVARQMLLVLESLGATPMARKALMKGVTPDVGTGDRNDKLDELRKRRDRRAYGATAMDSTSP